LTRREVYYLLALIIVPLLYFIPIPFGLWRDVPGRDVYASVLTIIEQADTARPLAIYSGVGIYSWLALLPPMAVFLSVTKLPVETLKRVTFLLLGLAVLQSILGLIQFANGPQSGLGTYPNRNHLAGFLEMIFPIALMLWFQFLLRKLHDRGVSRVLNAKNIFLFFVLFTILLGLIFSRSRSGLGLLMIGMILVTVISWRMIGNFNVNKIVIVSFLLILTVAAEIGLTPVLERFSQQDPLSDLRWLIFSNSWEGIRTFFPFGAGPGSFPYLFPRFQSPEIGNFVNHAHNDYMEWFFEYGVFGFLLVLVGLLLFISRWVEIFRRPQKDNFVFIQIGAGIGIILLLLHSIVDFNLRIPANAIYFAFLCGLFFRRTNLPAVN
jgi:O-antigen ligase